MSATNLRRLLGIDLGDLTAVVLRSGLKYAVVRDSVKWPSWSECSVVEFCTTRSNDKTLKVDHIPICVSVAEIAAVEGTGRAA